MRITVYRGLYFGSPIYGNCSASLDPKMCDPKSRNLERVQKDRIVHNNPNEALHEGRDQWGETNTQ